MSSPQVIDLTSCDLEIPVWPLHLPGLNEYQGVAARFAVYPDKMYPVLGLAEEAGEVIGKFAKAVRKGVEVDKEAVKKELGDVLWNVAMVARECGLFLEEIAQDNIAKLLHRQAHNTIIGEGDYR